MTCQELLFWLRGLIKFKGAERIITIVISRGKPHWWYWNALICLYTFCKSYIPREEIDPINVEWDSWRGIIHTWTAQGLSFLDVVLVSTNYLDTPGLSFDFHEVLAHRRKWWSAWSHSVAWLTIFWFILLWRDTQLSRRGLEVPCLHRWWNLNWWE